MINASRSTTLLSAAAFAAAGVILSASPVRAADGTVTQQQQQTTESRAVDGRVTQQEVDRDARDTGRTEGALRQLGQPFAGDDAVGPAVDPAISAREANNIRGTLATATEAALTQGELESLVQRLTTADQARLAEFARQDHPQLDQLIDQFERAWRDRYGVNFNIRDRSMVYDASIVRMSPGILPEAQTAGEQIRPDEQQLLQQQEQQRPVRDPILQGDTGTGVHVETRVDRDRGVGAGIVTDAAVDPNRANQVTVIFPAQHGLPELAIPMVNEGTVLDAWRIDAPMTLDGNKLRDNLHRQLSFAHQQIAQFPADVNEAYRLVSHHVMLALLDRDHEAGQQQAGQEGFQQEAVPAAGTLEAPQQQQAR